MRNIWLIGLALTTVLATAPTAKADSYYFTLNGAAYPDEGSAISGNGSLAGSYLSGSGSATTYNLNSMSGTLDVGGTDYGIIGAILNTPANQTIYDANLVYNFDSYLTPGTAPYVDSSGLLIQLTGDSLLSIWEGTDGNNYWDVYNGGSLVYEKVNGTSEWVWDGGTWIIDPYAGYDDQGGDPITLGFTPTPEPSSWLLLGTGLFLLAGLLLWKAKPSMVRAA